MSLLPAATEIVCALSARGDLVGISHECDYPADVAGLPVLTRSPSLPPGGSSAQIDGDLRRLIQQGLSIYELDLPALCALSPDVILTQDLCAVCAVSQDDLQRAVGDVLGPHVQVISLRPRRMQEIFGDFQRVAAAIGRQAEGEALSQALRDRVEVLRFWASHAPEIPRTLTIEWLSPVMLGGLWMPELVRMAGGEALGPGVGQKAQTLDLPKLAALSPEVVLIKPCGFSLSRGLSELQLLPQALPWTSWPAVQAGRVYLADGNAYFNRPGPRIVDGLEILATILHPGIFFEHAPTYRHAVVRIDADLHTHSL